MKNITVSVSNHPIHKDITLISVKGFIDTNTAPEFDKSFQSALAEKKFNIVVDLKDVTYISSAGWGLFVGEIKRIRNQKGDLFLANMSPEVEEAYELLQFSTILKSFPTVDQALQKGFKRSAGKATASKAGKELEFQLAGKTVQASVDPETDAETRPTKHLSKPNWFERILNPSKWF